MIDALIAGRLYGIAKQGAGKNGNTYITAKVKAAADHGETLLCSVIAFDDKAPAALLALDDGDSVAISGALTPKVWTDKALAVARREEARAKRHYWRPVRGSNSASKAT